MQMFIYDSSYVHVYTYINLYVIIVQKFSYLCSYLFSILVMWCTFDQKCDQKNDRTNKERCDIFDHESPLGSHGKNDLTDALWSVVSKLHSMVVVFSWNSSSINGCLPSSINKGCIQSKVVFQFKSSINSHLPLTKVFHRKMSSLKSCLFSKVVVNQ